MQTDRKKRSGFMLAYPFEEKRLYKWGFPVLVQPKLDGVRCGLDFDESGNVILRSSTQEIITSVPHINAEIEELCASYELTTPLLDGELYIHGLSFEDIYSITGRTVNFHSEFTKIEFHCFDLISFHEPQFVRSMKLKDYFDVIPPSAPLKLVKTFPASSFDDIWNLYQAFLADGYEGIIVREINNLYLPRRSTQVMKFKPKKDDWYTVIGYKPLKGYVMSLSEVKQDIIKSNILLYEELELKTDLSLRSFKPEYSAVEEKPMIGALICLGSGGDTFDVGSGLTDKQRTELWGQDLTGWLCHVEYQSVFPGTSKPRFPVFMELVQPSEVLNTH